MHMGALPRHLPARVLPPVSNDSGSQQTLRTLPQEPMHEEGRDPCVPLANSYLFLLCCVILQASINTEHDYSVSGRRAMALLRLYLTKGISLVEKQL